jgi:two-component system KDP operon response regulator KdpE
LVSPNIANLMPIWLSVQIRKKQYRLVCRKLLRRCKNRFLPTAVRLLMNIFSMKARPPIIIIEDEADLRGMLGEICRRRSYQVLSSGTISDAKVFLQQTPGLSFIDNNLPDGTGLDFIRTIRVNNRNMVIIMMTAQSSDQLRANALESGANFFLEKPFTVKQINELLDRFYA